MMQDRLNEDLKAAMRARDEVRLRTIRSLRAALTEREIELRQGGTATLDDEQAMAVVQKQAKQRRDAIEQYEAADREDLAAREREELEIIESYLPEQLGDEDLRRILQEIIVETGAGSVRDMGRVMGAAMDRLRGRADGKRVQQLVREMLPA